MPLQKLSKISWTGSVEVKQQKKEDNFLMLFARMVGEPMEKQQMKKEYDFSKGERGRFYRPHAELYLPIYLDPDMMEVLRKFSKKKGIEVAAIVSEWIKKDISIVETISNDA